MIINSWRGRAARAVAIQEKAKYRLSKRVLAAFKHWRKIIPQNQLKNQIKISHKHEPFNTQNRYRKGFWRHR
jgi:hypothetical protein